MVQLQAPIQMLSDTKEQAADPELCRYHTTGPTTLLVNSRGSPPKFDGWETMFFCQYLLRLNI